jgi:hypothetical protein
MNKTNVPNFSREDGLIIQNRQSHHYAEILRKEAWQMLDEEIQRQNRLLPGNADGNDVWRGIDMDNYVVNDILDFFNPIK